MAIDMIEHWPENSQPSRIIICQRNLSQAGGSLISYIRQ
jgi:hypothetical protein